MTARLHCVVPHCRCTRGDRKRDPLPADLTGYTWICAKHWRTVPSSVKARRRQLDRRAARIHGLWHRKAHLQTLEQWEQCRDALQRARARAFEAWEACVAAAIETAAGI